MNHNLACLPSFHHLAQLPKEKSLSINEKQFWYIIENFSQLYKVNRKRPWEWNIELVSNHKSRHERFFSVNETSIKRKVYQLKQWIFIETEREKYHKRVEN